MEHDKDESAFAFEGNWREFAPIAFTNLGLTIVTLGIYRFWAKARTRRYLWSHTRFIDDRLQWAGTGMELFKGALMALVIFVLPYFLLTTATQTLALRGYTGTAGLLGFATIIMLFYLVGVARFRSLRYRLARTYWRGIRGGSDDPGLQYGWAYMWKTFVGTMLLGLLIPWSMVELWNDRWNKMSFGPFKFSAKGNVDGLMGRFLLFYMVPIIAIFGMGGLFASLIASGAFNPGSGPTLSPLIILVPLVLYFTIGLVFMAFYAKFYRQMVYATSLHTLEFQFSARTMDWIKLLVVDVLLVIGTLGVGLMFLDYRHWKFFIDHLEATGHIDVADLTQSETAELKEGEGLLDAFDMGAL